MACVRSTHPFLLLDPHHWLPRAALLDSLQVRCCFLIGCKILLDNGPLKHVTYPCSTIHFSFACITYVGNFALDFTARLFDDANNTLNHVASSQIGKAGLQLVVEDVVLTILNREATDRRMRSATRLPSGSHLKCQGS